MPQSGARCPQTSRSWMKRLAGVLPFETEMAVVAFTSQARGFFSKAATDGLRALKARVRRDFETERTAARLSRAVEVAERLGTTVTAVVRAYINSQPFVAIPIVGCRNLQQLRESLTDADLVLSADVLQYLRGLNRDRQKRSTFH